MNLPGNYRKIIKQRLAEKGVVVSLSTIEKTRTGQRKNFHVLKEMKSLAAEYSELINN
jgi:hypothetical protein